MFKLKFLIIFFVAIFSLQQAKSQQDAKANITANCSASNPSFPFLTYAPGKNEANAVKADIVVSCKNMKQDIPYALGLSKPKQLFIMNKGSEIMYYQLFTSRQVIQSFGMIIILFLELLKMLKVVAVLIPELFMEKFCETILAREQEHLTSSQIQ
jgi:hypothetical protein